MNSRSGEATRAKWGVQSAIVTAAFAAAVLTFGCGSHTDRVASGSDQASPSGEPTSVALASGPGARASEGEPHGQTFSSVSADSLPPDVIATLGDTLATPGSVIEITAEGSSDVEAMVLSDGRGDAQAFTYDPATKIWRVFYRVPMKPVDRLGLAVTAQNGLNRWRRVWVFVHVQSQVSEDVDEEGRDS